MAEGVYCVADALYMDGRRVEVIPSSRLFVYTKEKTLAKMDVTQEEFELLERTGLHMTLSQTRLWKEKLLPQILSHAPAHGAH
jgi:hypothetical protein